METIQEATRRYERWLGSRLRLIATDLAAKHAAMRDGEFPFLRATCYRWLQLWPRICPELTRAPSVMAVADLHVENFGLWRDAEGRLVWGVNDYDEACRLPYTADLVRLATSAQIAIRDAKTPITITPKKAVRAILDGYRKSVEAGGKSFCAGRATCRPPGTCAAKTAGSRKVLDQTHES